MSQDFPTSLAADMEAAVAHDRAGRLEEAERRYAEILAREADTLAAAFNLGLVQLRRGRPEAAEASFARALQIAPAYANAMVNRGTALKALNRPAEAEACYRGALALEPGHAAAIRNLGILFNLLERHQDALEAADLALTVAGTPESFIARGDALYGLGRFEDALASYAEAGNLSPDPYETLIKAAIARTPLRQYPQALALLEEAVALRPENPLAYFQRASIRLLTCDFAGGWRDYEFRWRNALFNASSAAMVSPQVRESLALNLGIDDVRGRRVLLVGEQGIGDQVMFASMIPDLAAVAASVTCVCDSRLLGLFSNSFPAVRFVDPGATNLSRSAFDLVVAMGSLGRIFRNRIEDFPGTAYLRPREDVVARWAARLGARPKGLRIGLSWRGGTPGTSASQRSLALARLAPRLEAPGDEFVSLQYGDVSAEVAAVNAGLAREIRVFLPGDIDDYEELAGLIANLDLVVSVQTSVVHLTGALGTECRVMVPYNPIWRYTANAATMPWYRSARIFRQPEPEGWDPVIESVAETLRASRPPART
ncbi:tetratricopeptide repeat protein [Phenylobacterium sp.]|uniref:tetratricopeptide repeat protein n=1 Tax=Phenylobacterium sp. TaxID=1871053 RepID=UPI00356AB1C0